jgi:hypothetical protein
VGVERLGNQPHPMIQTFPKFDAAFQDDNNLIHTARTLQSWLEEHEGELGQHSQQIWTSLNHFGQF